MTLRGTTDYWNGKTAIVTGAASGIGRALAAALVERGALVVATDIDGEAVAAVAARLGPPAVGRELDVRDTVGFQDLVARVVDEKGRLDFLFNNAGVGIAGEVKDLTLAHWERVIDVNLWGTVHGVHAAYPVMLSQRSGHIVNVASLAGLGATAFLVPYATSKHAIVGLSTSLRTEAAAYGVRISVLCPATIETPMLDAQGPCDLRPLAWRPDVRHYLTRLCGRPYPAERFANEALDAVARNKAVIVIPRRARFAWRLMRAVPSAAERFGLAAVRAERKAARANR